MKPMPLDYQVQEALKILARYKHVSKGDFILRRVGATAIASLVETGLATVDRGLNGGIVYTLTAAGKARLPSDP
ncbi:hypothetical protein [Rhizobiales bacterium]|uniref:hypothetical protein n=1 Tax=unclassified Neorhizobium TaxID=2629175 RepID=UPI0013B004C4